MNRLEKNKIFTPKEGVGRSNRLGDATYIKVIFLRKSGLFSLLGLKPQLNQIKPSYITVAQRMADGVDGFSPFHLSDSSFCLV